MNCQNCQSVMPDLLLDPASAGAKEARGHLDLCLACREELDGLQGAMATLDQWIAPEPSPWFDGRLAARLREEQAAAPAGWIERLRSRLLFNTGRQFRPALAGAFALALLIGGGTAASISGALHPKHADVSATVQDLQILDRNDQAIQTMDLLQDDGSSDDGSSDAPTS